MMVEAAAGVSREHVADISENLFHVKQVLSGARRCGDCRVKPGNDE
jgi:hypothetical protein